MSELSAGKARDFSGDDSAIENSLVFVVSFLASLVQLAPSVTTGDAGEFTAAAATLSVAHAPGYPTYSLLGKLFGTVLHVGSWSYRTNLLSALVSAAALVLFNASVRRFGAGLIARLGAAALLGLMPLFREQAAVTEVFSVHAFFACLLLWLCSFPRERLVSDHHAFLLGMVFGLGLGNHQTLILLLPAVLLIGRPHPRALLLAVLGGLAGFAVHAVIPLRAAKHPPLDWGHAVTPHAFWRLLTRADYGSLSLTVDGGEAGGPALLLLEAWRSLRSIGAQLGPLGAALALAGAALFPRSGLRLPARAAWAWVLCCGPLFLAIGRPPFDAQTSNALERFALLPAIGAALCAAAALELLARARPALGALSALAAAGALLPSAAAETRRGDFLAHDYGRTLLRQLPPGAAFVMDGGDDTFYSVAALRFAHGLRPELEMFDRGGVVFRHPYGPDFRRLSKPEKELRRAAVERALAESGRLRYSTLGDGILPGWTLLPAGLLRRPARAGEKPAELAGLRESTPMPRAPTAARRHRDRGLLAFFLYQRGVDALARGAEDEAVSWFESAAEAGGDSLWTAPTLSYALAMTGYAANSRGALPQAERAYRAQAELDPGSADALLNLGVVLERAGQEREAERALDRALGRAPGLPRVHEGRGAFFWRTKRWRQSAESYAAAAALQPGNAEYRERARRAAELARGAR